MTNIWLDTLRELARDRTSLLSVIPADIVGIVAEKMRADILPRDVTRKIVHNGFDPCMRDLFRQMRSCHRHLLVLGIDDDDECGEGYVCVYNDSEPDAKSRYTRITDELPVFTPFETYVLSITPYSYYEEQSDIPRDIMITRYEPNYKCEMACKYAGEFVTFVMEDFTHPQIGKRAIPLVYELGFFPHPNLHLCSRNDARGQAIIIWNWKLQETPRIATYINKDEQLQFRRYGDDLLHVGRNTITIIQSMGHRDMKVHRIPRVHPPHRMKTSEIAKRFLSPLDKIKWERCGDHAYPRKCVRINPNISVLKNGWVYPCGKRYEYCNRDGARFSVEVNPLWRDYSVLATTAGFLDIVDGEGSLYDYANT